MRELYEVIEDLTNKLDRVKYHDETFGFVEFLSDLVTELAEINNSLHNNCSGYEDLLNSRCEGFSAAKRLMIDKISDLHDQKKLKAIELIKKLEE